MTTSLELSPLQVLRTRLHLFLVGVRKRLTVGARAVLIDGERVLLIRHTYLPGWHFPGGGVEPGETARAAAAREAGEETGYAVEGEPALLGLYLNRLAGGSRDHVAVYVWRQFRQERPFVANLEIAECAWFAFDQLPVDTEAGTRRRLAELRNTGNPAAPEW